MVPTGTAIASVLDPASRLTDGVVSLMPTRLLVASTFRTVGSMSALVDAADAAASLALVVAVAAEAAASEALVVEIAACAVDVA